MMSDSTFVKLDNNALKILCCPFCKADLNLSEGYAKCESCASDYTAIGIDTGKSTEQIFDFKIKYPNEFTPTGHVKWAELQEEFEDFHDHYDDLDSEKVYLDEIDSVKEIYEQEFDLKGKVLDVGGNQGRLRHYLDLESPDTLYMSVDPYINVFRNISKFTKLLNAFPSLNKSCNFVSGSAEHLPVKSETFDWVHMRSVIDHFENPFFALKEAYRVLKPGGRILIGLAIEEKGIDDSRLKRVVSKFKNEGISSVGKAVQRRVKGLAKGHIDDHMFRFGDKELIALVEKCGFEIEKTHWQKPPFSYCIYLSAKKV